MDFVTNLRLFLILISKPNEEIVNHILNKTSKTESAGRDYQYQFHHICQEGSDAWIVKLNRLKGRGLINLTSQRFIPVYTQQVKEDDKNMFYTQFIIEMDILFYPSEWNIILSYISETLYS